MKIITNDILDVLGVQFLKCLFFLMYLYLERSGFMKYINRNLEKIIKNFIGKYPIIMITGPRQIGKTTLLNYLLENLKNINYVTLDDLMIRIQTNEDPSLFLRTYETPLIIDEFQYAPNLLSYIKMNVDENRRKAMFANGDEVGTKYLYFYRDKNQKEIDLLVIDNGKVYPVEIKQKGNPGKEAIKNFSVVSKFGMEVMNGIVLCLCKNIYAIDENNYAVPIEYI